MRHADPVDTIQDTTAPYLRAALHYDKTPTNPLDDWDHGIQFKTLPSAGHRWSNYKEPTSNGEGLDFYPEDFADFAGEYQDSRYDPDKGWIPYGKRNPTLRHFLDTHTAAWCLINRNGHDGSLHAYAPGDIDIDDADAIAYVSRAEFRKWHMIPEGKPMPRGYRDKAREALKAVISEYNAYATGDVYGIIVEYHDPEACPRGKWSADVCDPNDPRDDCNAWTETKVSCWGFRGYDYATGDAAQEMLSEARAYPEYRPDYEDPEPPDMERKLALAIEDQPPGYYTYY